jgi:hypothetical protein
MGSVEEAIILAREKPETAWSLILEILARASDDFVVGMVGASLLEDLLGYHGQQFIVRIEQEAPKNSRLLEALRGMYQTTSDDVWFRVQRLLN